MRPLILIPALLLPLLFAACHAGRNSVSESPRRHGLDVASVTWADIRVAPGSKIGRDTIQAIVTARGGKDSNEIWTMHNESDGTIRIRKSRKDSKVHPPGAAVEFWHQDDLRSWKRSFSA